LRRVVAGSGEDDVIVVRPAFRVHPISWLLPSDGDIEPGGERRSSHDESARGRFRLDPEKGTFLQMPILRYSPASPYARKVRIVAEILGFGKDVELVGADTSDPADSLRAQNPLGKIPVLVLANGDTLYDSRVIAEYFDVLAGGGRLFPNEPAARFEALKLQALGDGINDAALLIRYETVSRPEPLRHAETLALQAGKVERGLAQLDARPPSGPVTIGHIAVAAALGYQDLRFDGAWRAKYPNLVAWLDEFSKQVPAYEATNVA
jgi:glutathione S-transferase